MKKIAIREGATRGRPTVDSEALNLRLTSDVIAQIDEWRKGQADIPNRQEAVRRLLKVGIATYSMIRPLRNKIAHSVNYDQMEVFTTIMAINMMAEAVQEEAYDVADSIQQNIKELHEILSEKSEKKEPAQGGRKKIGELDMD